MATDWRAPNTATQNTPERIALQSLERSLKARNGVVDTATAAAQADATAALAGNPNLVRLKTLGYAADAPPRQAWERTAVLSVANTTWSGDAGSFTVSAQNQWKRSPDVAVSAFSASRFTVDTAGWYRITLNHQWAANTTADRAIRISHTAGNKDMGGWKSATAFATNTMYTAMREMDFAAGDSFGVNFWQSSGAALNMTYCQLVIEFMT